MVPVFRAKCIELPKDMDGHSDYRLRRGKWYNIFDVSESEGIEYFHVVGENKTPLSAHAGFFSVPKCNLNRSRKGSNY